MKHSLRTLLWSLVLAGFALCALPGCTSPKDILYSRTSTR